MKKRVALALSAVLVVAIVLVVAPWQVNESRVPPGTEQILKQIHSAMLTYAGDWRGKYPPMSRNPGAFIPDMDAFGLGSVFGRLYGMHSKILFVGVPFAKCCTFVHFIEQLWAVPYRQQRHFQGKVLENGVEVERKCSHFAKPQDGSVVADFQPLETLLRNENYLKETEVDGGTVGVAETRYVFQCARKLLSENMESLITRTGEK